MEEKLFKDFKEKFDDLVKNHKGRVVITAHKGPDDDSIASVISTYKYVQDNLNVTPSIIYTGDRMNRWEKIPFYSEINFVTDLSTEIKSTDLVILLDCRELQQISNKPEELSKIQYKCICIDHHKTKPTREYELSLLYPTVCMSSNAEIIYTVFYKQKNKLPIDIAEILLLGIYSDTGSFRYVTLDTLSVFDSTKEIIEKSGISVDLVRNKLDETDKEIYEVVGILLRNQKVMEIDGWPRFNVSHITMEDASKYSRNFVSSGKGLFGAMFQKNVRGSSWGFMIYPMLDKEGSWSLSFRSQPGQPNVRIIGEFFGGGGHDAASGGKLEESELKIKLNEQVVLEKVLEYLKNNKPEIIPL